MLSGDVYRPSRSQSRIDGEEFAVLHCLRSLDVGIQ